MKASVGRRYKRRHRYLSTLLMKNPVSVLGLELPFIVVMATSLKNAVALSIEMLLVHMVTMLFAVLTCRKLPRWGQALANTAVATLMMIVAQQLITWMFKDISNALGMYIYLMAVNGLTMVHSSSLRRRERLQTVMGRALFNVLVFAVSMLLVSVVREYFGNGTLWGIVLPVPIKLSGLLIPFSGFILVGFFLAFAKMLTKKLLGIGLADQARRQAHFKVIDVVDLDSLE